MPLPCFSQKLGGKPLHAADQQIGIFDGLVAGIILRVHADDRRLDAQIDVLRHQRHPGAGEFLLQRQSIGENGVVGPVPRQARRQHRFEQLRLEEQPTAGRTLAVIDRHRGRQRESAIDLLLRRIAHQLVEEAAHLAHVAGRLRQALFPGVELFEHGHRDVDVVLLEAKDRGRIVHEHVGVEHENAPALASAERPLKTAAATGRSRARHSAFTAARTASA